VKTLADFQIGETPGRISSPSGALLRSQARSHHPEENPLSTIGSACAPALRLTPDALLKASAILWCLVAFAGQYFMAKDRGDAAGKYAVAGTLVGAAMATGLGVLGLTLGTWAPRIMSLL